MVETLKDLLQELDKTHKIKQRTTNAGLVATGAVIVLGAVKSLLVPIVGGVLAIASVGLSGYGYIKSFRDEKEILLNVMEKIREAYNNILNDLVDKNHRMIVTKLLISLSYESGSSHSVSLRQFARNNEIEEEDFRCIVHKLEKNYFVVLREEEGDTKIKLYHNVITKSIVSNKNERPEHRPSASSSLFAESPSEGGRSGGEPPRPGDEMPS